MFTPAPNSPAPISSLILKIAGNCNLNCTYCYWFKKAEVRTTYGNMSVEVEERFLQRFDEHLHLHSLSRFHISMHGGEPLLFPKARFRRLCERLRAIGDTRGCQIEISVNTNGTLIDREWCDIFRQWVNNVGVSIDGPKAIHDRLRIDLNGKGSYDRVMVGVNFLRAAEIHFGILCVANPDSNPTALVKLFVEDLKIKSFDVLIPDATHDSPPVSSISSYYNELFDIYLQDLAPQGIKIRILQELVRTSLGFPTRTQSVGQGPIRTIMVKQDGQIEPLDTLHNLAEKYSPTNLSVFNNKLNDITADPIWLKLYFESSDTPRECRTCRHKNSCGGGNVVERWSSANGFDNKSVYCSDLMKIYDHVGERILEHLL